MDGTAPARDAEVIIVGGGPVGLALAVELGQRGVRTLLLERNERHADAPRAKTTNVRSMAHMRRWGLAERIRAASPLPPGYPTDIIFATRLFGERLATVRNAFNGYPDRDERYPEHAQWIPQYKVDGVLRDRAAALPSVTLGFGTVLEGLRQTAEGVEAEVSGPGGAKRTLRAAFLVGADGSRSRVRSLLGIRMAGEHAFAQNINLVIRALALRDAFGGGRAVMYWLVNPDCPAIAGPMDLGDTWYFGFPLPAGQPVPDGAALQRLVALAFGRDLEVEILKVDPWAAHSLLAERYAEGRVFLAGDACHLHPPFGGFGMNLGIADAVDLGWKLAARLQGWGGERLLGSYEAERRPAHQRVVQEAVTNYATLADKLVRPGLEEAGPAGDAARAEAGALIDTHKVREFHTLGIVLGTHYGGSPIVVPDGSAPPVPEVTEFHPSARPGCLAPHLWLRDGRSLYDLFGVGLTLLVADPGAGPEAADIVAGAAGRAGVPLSVAEPGDERLAALYGARLALIRPDQHVAWRGDEAPEDAARILDTARGAAVPDGERGAASSSSALAEERA